MQRDDFLSLWTEFEEKKSSEAQFASAIDILQPLLNHLLTAKENENPHNLTKSIIIKMKRSIEQTSPVLWEVALDIINKSVEKGLYIDI